MSNRLEHYRLNPEGNSGFQQFAEKADGFAVETVPVDYGVAEAIISDTEAIMMAREAVNLAYAKDDTNNGGSELQEMEGLTNHELTEMELEFSREEISAYEDLRLGSTTTNYMKFVRSIPMLSEAEEKRLGKLVMAGDKDALYKLVEANLRWGVNIASRYHQNYENSSLSLDDLIQEANIGLMRAAQKFNPDRGRFTTYAGWWIRRGVGRALVDQAKLVRLPVHATETLSKIGGLGKTLKRNENRIATLQEMADVTGKSEENIKEILQATQPPISLDSPPVGYEDGDLTVKDAIEDTLFEKPEQGAVKTQLAEMVRKVVDTLAQYDRRAPDIIRYRYGLNGEGERTLQEVGEMYHITRERVRQIEKIAIRRLRQLLNKHGNKQILNDMQEFDR